MADVWTYDGVDAIGVTFTPESLTKQYYVAVDFGGTSGLQGPYPGGGPQLINVTASAPPVGDFFSAIRYDEDSIMRAVGLFLTGTSGSQTVTHTPLTYDGASTVSTNVSTSNVLYEYALASNDPDSTITWVAGTGGTVAVSVADVGGLGAGDPFLVHLLVRVAGAGGFGAFVAPDDEFIFGTPGVGAGPEVDPEVSSGGGVRVMVAFDDVTLEPDPEWTDIASLTPTLVASFSIDRGRAFELDRTDTGIATVRINDRTGVLDPTNASGPYYGLLEPLLQIRLDLWDPVAEAWSTLYRGYIEDFDYTVRPWIRQNEDGDTEGVLTLEIGCVDAFAILTAIEMQPTDPVSFGDTVPAASAGNIFFDNAEVDDRITQALGNAGWPVDLTTVFSGNVSVQESVYSPSENILQVIQDAADAEFPGVGNVYTSRLGMVTFHGRLAKFDPEGVADSAGDAWPFTHWKAGDEKAVVADLYDSAQIRSLSFNRGLSKIINQALATPTGIADDDIAGQVSTDTGSIATYGIRSWSAENLLTEAGLDDGFDANEETKLFADYYVAAYAQPKNRISGLTFRSMHKDDSRAAANWRLLCGAEISDVIDVTVTQPGEGGFNLEPFFIEGVHYEVGPLNGEYANVTLTLDLSPQSYYLGITLVPGEETPPSGDLAVLLSGAPYEDETMTAVASGGS